jgi:hypothetical protein
MTVCSRRYTPIATQIDTTPVVYLYLDRFSHWCGRIWAQRRGNRFSSRTPDAAPY